MDRAMPRLTVTLPADAASHPLREGARRRGSRRSRPWQQRYLVPGRRDTARWPASRGTRPSWRGGGNSKATVHRSASPPLSIGSRTPRVPTGHTCQVGPVLPKLPHPQGRSPTMMPATPRTSTCQLPMGQRAFSLAGRSLVSRSPARSAPGWTGERYLGRGRSHPSFGRWP